MAYEPPSSALAFLNAAGHQLRRSIGSVDLWWTCEGPQAGEPLLLIHGLGYPSDMWYRQIPTLNEAGYRTIRFDNRGVGRTGFDQRGGMYSIEIMSDDAAAVIEAAGYGEKGVNVMGASLGGLIAQDLTLRYPKLVKTLILACTHPGGKHIAPFSQQAKDLLSKRKNLSSVASAELSVPLIYHLPTTSRHLIDEDIAVRLVRPTSAEGYTAQLQASIAYEGTYEKLEQIKVPVLLIVGKQDGLLNPENTDVIAGQLMGNAKSVEVVKLENSSHLFSTDQTKICNEMIIKFLNQYK
ncbi:unnamed protein product [Didymodactylos carnosus]|uniref:AB hydrolase-1 domain-containing protein n=1 Tax=Didymodactylos carnosus TaxID=1234261 RepID=A0A815C3K0_9BILA|nr:unnamed protein product [Didymodactylos carnosus]CAF1278582.1 unnamed protein product [Didymodactylos carnosus]CAF3661251.1 unnamed protein product [Didymodactylos carnosus]CAF4072198.1 unnamed protein product [Didymodactylos carnosus]